MSVMTLMRLDFYFFLNPSLDYVDLATTLKSVGNDAYIACILFWMCIQRRGFNKTRCLLSIATPLGPMKVFVQSSYCVSKIECIIATPLGPMKVFVWNFYCVLKIECTIIEWSLLGNL